MTENNAEFSGKRSCLKRIGLQHRRKEEKVVVNYLLSCLSTGLSKVKDK